ncbi:hypothetical protein C7I85_24045 [Mesorhizobium soli]|uniref:Uncharacterized protein n=1 Tax=Pseudaminobacter soli (ex Li et al. 2025) TaxID=1295366 RepID=A0A2P7S2E2_9HYPH|nr:hypothetical protein C7I85_24045 [Mesorhizobium soli]
MPRVAGQQFERGCWVATQSQFLILDVQPGSCCQLSPYRHSISRRKRAAEGLMRTRTLDVFLVLGLQAQTNDSEVSILASASED